MGLLVLTEFTFPSNVLNDLFSFSLFSLFVIIKLITTTKSCCCYGLFIVYFSYYVDCVSPLWSSHASAAVDAVNTVFLPLLCGFNLSELEWEEHGGGGRGGGDRGK